MMDGGYLEFSRLLLYSGCLYGYGLDMERSNTSRFDGTVSKHRGYKVQWMDNKICLDGEEETAAMMDLDDR